MRSAAGARLVANGHFGDARAVKRGQGGNEAVQLAVKIHVLENFGAIRLERCAEIAQVDAHLARLRKELATAHGGFFGVQAKWEEILSSSSSSSDLRKGLPKDVLMALDVPSAKRTKPQAELLARHFESSAPELKPLRDKIVALEKSRPAIPSLPVMVELPKEKRRVSRILRKGNFLDPGQAVQPAILSAPSPQHHLSAS